jgi:hypothetical protein
MTAGGRLLSFSGSGKTLRKSRWGLEVGSRGLLFGARGKCPVAVASGVAARALWRYQGSDRAIAQVSVVLSRAAGRRLLIAPFAEGVIYNGNAAGRQR